MMKSVTLTGHRFIPFSKRNELCINLTKAIMEAYDDGVRNFNCGMALGFDMLAAEVVLEMKKEFPGITLTAVIPFLAQYERWPEDEKLRYHRICKKADKIITLSQKYYNGCLLKRNDYMLEHCDGVISYYNGNPRGGTFYTYRKAKIKGLPIANLYWR